MSEANEFKFSVIQFAEVPYKDVADYVCVPRSWVHARGPNDPKVRVSYPVEDPLETEIRVKKRKKKSDEWNSYLSVIKFRTDDYDDAKRYIERMIPPLQNEDPLTLTPLPSAKVEGKPRRSKRKSKTENTTTLEQKASSDPHSKRSRVTEPDQSDDKAAVAASQAFEVTSKDLSLLHKTSDKDHSTPETPVTAVKNRYGLELVPTVKQNLAEANRSLGSEEVVKQALCGEFIRGVLRELQMDFQVYTASLLAKAVNKIMNNVTVFENTWPYNYTVPLPTITPEKASEPNERNEKQAEVKDIDDDDEDQPLDKISSLKQIKKVILPPEYDENDSKWTLKYREPAPGLVELMEYSSVYVKALKLTKCKRLSKDCKSLARMVLSEIFTTSALGTCSWTGARAKAFDQDGTNVRPGLDEHARTVLMNYVAEYARQEGWYFENHTILNSIRNKMQEMRVKYKSRLSKSKLL